MLKTIANLLILAGLPTIAMAEAVPKSPSSRICMTKMTSGYPGGDHPMTIEIYSEDVSELRARGFLRTECNGKERRTAILNKQMCNLAIQGGSAVATSFAAIHSVTPAEICNWTKHTIEMSQADQTPQQN